MSNRHALLLAISLLTCCVPSGMMAQLPPPIIAPAPHRDIGYFELGGPGGFYSVNYERRLRADRVARFGATSYGFTNLVGVRHEATALLGGATHLVDVSETPGFGGGTGKYVELGAVLIAGAFTHAQYDRTEGEGGFVALSPTVGLRSDPPNGGFLLRLGFTPIIGLAGGAGTSLDGRTAMSAGISAGYVF